MNTPVTLALTAGEPAGIGPELCLQLAAEERTAGLVVIASRHLLEARNRALGLGIVLEDWAPGSCATRAARALSVLHVEGLAATAAGQLDPANSPYVLESLAVATRGCLDGLFDGMVTGPVHKGVINDAGIEFSGHTEFLQGRAGGDDACHG